MSSDVSDLRSTIIPKSDQLNTDQLLGGPMVITVKDVRVGGGDDQPVSIFHDTDPARPFKPCKTMRKVLIHAWGPDGRQWIGRSMELYAEPSVKFGGEIVGGIRISRLTDIPKEIKVSLTATKGRKTLHEIGLLKLSEELTKVLEAIGVATGRDSLHKAKAMAEKLTREEDRQHARAAYAKKVEALKEKAAGAQAGAAATQDTGEIVFTEEQVEKNLRVAATTDILDLARDQIASVQDEEARARLAKLADELDAQLREPA